MKFTVELDFWFDGMDDYAIDEIEKTLECVFESGAEATCSDLTLLSINNK